MRTSIKSTTDQRKKQFKKFVNETAERALAEVGLDEERFQKLFENAEAFQTDIVASIWVRSTPDQIADEEVATNSGYLSGYKPKKITEQTTVLRRLFPGIGYADEQITCQPRPPYAEGWFAIPRWEKIASSYGEAVQKVLDLIKETRDGKFFNYREGQLGPQYLRQSAKTVKGFQILGNQQKDYNILVVLAQFGLRHKGRTVRQARTLMNASEFGLGAYETGIMLLTHPERLQHYDDLWIDCAGDEFAPAADGDFSSAPVFGFHDEVGFGAPWVDFSDGYCGSASVFLTPQGS